MLNRRGHVTIKDIAQMCGVSRGTVDRVLNGRGKVKKEIEELVLKTIRESQYTKNRAGRALRVLTSQPVIGVIVSGGGNPFIDDVLAGIYKAQTELADYGVRAEIINLHGYDVQTQRDAICSLQPRISVLILQAINDPRIAQSVSELKQNGVPTITVNTDLESSQRILYVGSDYVSGGETAAGLLGLIRCGKGNLGIISGVSTLLGHMQRLHGFQTRLQERFCDIRIVARDSAMDDDEHSYQATMAMLRRHPEIDCLQLIAAGTYGACRAVIDSKREKKIDVLAFDNVPTTIKMVKLGIVRAVVCQQPFQQGYLAFNAAFDTILSGNKAQTENIIVENQIRILENI